MAGEFKKFEDKVLSDMVRHDEDVIDKKREDINIHSLEEGEDKSKFMKDLREKEMAHDEKVIERKEHDADKHLDKIKTNEQDLAAEGEDK